MSDFDWVRERANCTLRTVFERLVSGVKGDVDERQRIVTESGQHKRFEYHEEVSGRLLVTRAEPGYSAKVEFVHSADRITIEKAGKSSSARPGLLSKGECALIVDGVEMQLWQVRRFALGELFFTEAPSTQVTVTAGKLPSGPSSVK